MKLDIKIKLFFFKKELTNDLEQKIKIVQRKY